MSRRLKSSYEDSTHVDGHLLGWPPHFPNLPHHKISQTMKVYIVNTKLLTEEEQDLYIPKIPDEQFIAIARRSGDVFTERGFENAYNQDPLFDFVNSFIRFIED